VLNRIGDIEIRLDNRKAALQEIDPVVLAATEYRRSFGLTAQVVQENVRTLLSHYNYLSKSAFLDYVFQHFMEDNWSLDACVGPAILNEEFSREQIVFTRTLYRYVDLGLFGIRNHNAR
jgi:transposase, IS30 family